MRRALEMSRAVRRYERFHGRSPYKVGQVFIPYPRAVVHLGQGFAIEYESDKRVLSLGDKVSMERGKKRLYRHLFGPGVKVYTDAKGRALFITGGRFRVADWLRN